MFMAARNGHGVVIKLFPLLADKAGIEPADQHFRLDRRLSS